MPDLRAPHEQHVRARKQIGPCDQAAKVDQQQLSQLASHTKAFMAPSGLHSASRNPVDLIYLNRHEGGSSQFIVDVRSNGSGDDRPTTHHEASRHLRSGYRRRGRQRRRRRIDVRRRGEGATTPNGNGTAPRPTTADVEKTL